MNAAYALPPRQLTQLDRQVAQWVDCIPLYDGPGLLSAAHAIANLSTLPDNWDGQGSPRISASVATKGLEVIELLGSTAETLSHASPVPGGGIQLEWYLGGKYLEIEVRPDGSLEYFIEVNGAETEEGSLSLADRDALSRLVGYLSRR